MEDNKTKDMVVLKDVPSNIVQEAYIVLKPNVKQKFKITEETKKKTMPVYIVKEAENVISNYLASLEKNRIIRNTEVEKIKKKYIHVKGLCIGLGIFLILSVLLQIIK